MVRVLSMNNIMKLLRSVEKIHGETLIIEFSSDHSGCIKSASTYDIKEAWNDLEQFNELIKEHTNGGSVKPNRPTG